MGFDLGMQGGESADEIALVGKQIFAGWGPPPGQRAEGESGQALPFGHFAQQGGGDDRAVQSAGKQQPGPLAMAQRDLCGAVDQLARCLDIVGIAAQADRLHRGRIVVASLLAAILAKQDPRAQRSPADALVPAGGFPVVVVLKKLVRDLVIIDAAGHACREQGAQDAGGDAQAAVGGEMERGGAPGGADQAQSTAGQRGYRAV